MALFNKQKQDKPKKPESMIGKIIYGFLLFMPIIAVGVACLYVVFNKNAYQSYSDKMITKNEEITNVNQMIEDFTYTFINNEETTGNTIFIKYKNINIDWTEYGFDNNIYDQFALFGNKNVVLKDINGNSYQKSNIWGNTLKKFTIISDVNTSNSQFTVAKVYNQVYVQNTLDNVFYYEMERLEQSDLFNWTKETGTYTVMHNTTILLGITNTYTPMIMTYWLIISVIYFLYDIALILIWAVHDKIHALKDAI